MYKLVQEGIIGETPSKKGPTNKIPKKVYKTFVGAFESYVRIQQVNWHGGELTREK